MEKYRMIIILSTATAIIGLVAIFNPTFSSYQDNLQPVVLIRGGRKDSTIGNLLGQRKKYNIKFHRRLEQSFPDWPSRMKYENYQFKFYASGKKKLREARRLGTENSIKLSDKEKDAIDYFKGTGSYKKYQHPEVKPNIFDTRRSFLLKMHDPKLRRDFLNSYNECN